VNDADNNPPQPHGPLDDSVVRDFTSQHSDPNAPPPAADPNADPNSSVPPPSTTAEIHYVPALTAGQIHAAQQQVAREARFARLPQALRVPWGWADIVVLIASCIAVTFAVMIGFGILYYSRGNRAALDPTSPALLQFAVIFQGFLDVGILAFMLALVKWRYKLPAWSGLGWHQLPQWNMPRGLTVLGLIAGGILLSVLVGAAAQLHPPKDKLPVEQVMQDHRTAMVFLLLAVLIAPVIEETLFRGFLYPVVARSFGIPAGIIITGILFGLLHGSQLGNNLWLIVIMSTVGAIFTWVRARLDTVLASFILHTAYNGVQVVGVLIVTHGLTKALPST
jgi:membrane protease YdiL (CAAX protease family)